MGDNNNSLAPKYDIFVRQYEDNSPLTTLTVTSKTTLAEIHCCLIDRVPQIKSIARIQVWHNNKKVSDAEASLQNLHIEAGSTIFVEDKHTQFSHLLVSITQNLTNTL